MTSVSEVDWQMAPEEMRSRRSVSALVRLPLWATREAAGVEIGEQRLHVAQDGVAGGGVAVVAERDVALEAADHVGLVEVVADEAEAALGVEVGAVVGDDAGGLLAAMLQGVQAERGERRGVLVAEDAEHAALLAQAVVAAGPPAQLVPAPQPRCGQSSWRPLDPARSSAPGTAAATQALRAAGRARYRTTRTRLPPARVNAVVMILQKKPLLLLRAPSARSGTIRCSMMRSESPVDLM